jgi:hypothetical protein
MKKKCLVHNHQTMLAARSTVPEAHRKMVLICGIALLVSTAPPPPFLTPLLMLRRRA